MELSTVEQLAEELCEWDAGEAEAVLEDASAHPGWEDSSEQRRDLFRAQARQQLGLGEADGG